MLTAAAAETQPSQTGRNCQETLLSSVIFPRCVHPMLRTMTVIIADIINFIIVLYNIIGFSTSLSQQSHTVYSKVFFHTYFYIL